MKIARVMAAPATVAALWLATALAPALGPWPAALLGFIVVLIVPGYTIDRSLGIGRALGAHAAELPARSLALSVAMVGVLGAACAAADLSIRALLVTLGAVSMLLAFLPAAERHQRAPQQHDGRGDASGSAVLAFAALAVLAALMVAAAAATENIARDRMWYMAYISRLSSAGPISWQEPFFGTGRVASRFAYNAWILSMAAWKTAAQSQTAFLFSRVGPPILAALLASSALALARTLFGRGSSSAIPAVTTLLVYLATRYPFFSPDRYPLFGRLVEDKSVALMILLPVAVSLALDLMSVGVQRDRSSPTRALVATALTFVAVALSHALVFLLLLMTLVPLAVLIAAGSRGAQRRDCVAVVALACTIALVPAWLGLAARRDIVDVPVSAQLFTTDPTHPVIRSHLRMNRMVELPMGGPIVDPRLLTDPLLMLGVGAAVVVARRRRGHGEAFLALSSAVCLSAAFIPFVSPAFGTLVVPWMAYRALWGVPFGMLLGALVLSLGDALRPLGGSSAGPLTVLLILVTALAWPNLPWQRLAALGRATDPSQAGRAPRLGLDEQTRGLLREISKLPSSARLAAAAPLSELIAGHTAHRVMALSDRATVVFSGSRRDGEKRLQANAALIGLAGGSRRLRNRIVGAYDVTHTVYEARDCDRRTATIYRNKRFTLCAERAQPNARARLARVSAVAPPEPNGVVIAPLGNGLRCRPTPSEDGDRARYSWRRESRWSGKPVAVTCTARFAEEVRSLTLRIAARLPRAREALVYRLVARGAGATLRRQGAIDFHDNPYAEIRLPGYRIERVRLRLTPAYLPYLNLDALELRASP